MNDRTRISMMTLLLALALLTPACGTSAGDEEGAGPAEGAARTVPAGTELEAVLTATLDSGTSQAGDAFVATVREPVLIDGERAIPGGSKVTGKVTEVRAAKRGAGNARLALGFDGLMLPDGDFVPMTATFTEATASKKKRDSAIIGGSAAGGALLGRVLGDDGKDALVGAVVGGAIGTGVVLAQEGDQVRLPAGTVLVIRLDEPMRVPIS